MLVRKADVGHEATKGGKDLKVRLVAAAHLDQRDTVAVRVVVGSVESLVVLAMSVLLVLLAVKVGMVPMAVQVHVDATACVGNKELQVLKVALVVLHLAVALHSTAAPV
jgi:hypothetical protein